MKESILIHPLSDSNSVRDESFFTGHAFSASSPETADEVRQVILFRRAAHGITITPHGGLTGINGAGATATNNHSMNLQHLNRRFLPCQRQYAVGAGRNNFL